MTEICGPPVLGADEFAAFGFGGATAEGEACALVDARDSFDPGLASAAGVALNQLLWVALPERGSSVAGYGFTYTGGGFGLVAVDLSECCAEDRALCALNAWFRFSPRGGRYADNYLMVMEQEANAKERALRSVVAIEGAPQRSGRRRSATRACSRLSRFCEMSHLHVYERIRDRRGCGAIARAMWDDLPLANRNRAK